MSKKIIGICIGTTVVIAVALILILISLSSLEPLQYGLSYNKFTKAIGDKVYDAGRHMIGPTNTFLTYPSNLVTVEFPDPNIKGSEPLQTRTADGLGLVCYISFQYKVIKNEIPELYKLANTNYHGTFVRIARDQILQVAGKYNANDYWENRQVIGDNMKEVLDKELRKAHASCESLQILRIDLPAKYEESIVNTQVEVQKTEMRKSEQLAELIRQDIKVVVSQADNDIKVINSEATAEALKINQNATAWVQNNTISTESAVYKKVEDDLNMGGKANELNQYVFLNSLIGQEDAKLMVGLGNTIVNFGGMNSPVSTNEL